MQIEQIVPKVLGRVLEGGERQRGEGTIEGGRESAREREGGRGREREKPCTREEGREIDR